MEDLKALRKIAEAATPGPWEVCNVTEMDADGVTDLAHVLASELETEESVSAVAVSVIRHDATHIATFDPPTVLRLLDLVESEAEYAELNPKLAAILRDTANALKGEPEPLVIHSWHDLAEVATELTTRLEQAEQAVARVREVHCRMPVKVNFYAQPTDFCKYCYVENLDEAEYPCPTIRALDGDSNE